MSKTVINGIDFYNFFKSGAEEVQKNKDDLNMINVFPVKDGDTGTNLTLTMNSIVAEATVSEDFYIVINSMSDAAFENARGNSGIIFASFLSGFSAACGKLKVINLEQFSVGATLAVKEAYSAVSTPVEGTMLTVIREWASYIGLNHESHHHFSDMFDAAYEKAKQVLEETPEMLEILKRNRVVDSGAKGFVTFLSGFNKIFTEILHHDETQKKQDDQTARISLQSEEKHYDIPNYRYCTEVLLHENIREKDKVKELISNLGDSTIVTGNERLLKIHIHTNHPDEVTKVLIENKYKINKSKVDDMVLQMDVETNRKSKIAIFTDSIADLSPEQIIEEQIHMLSLPLIADDSVYLDKLTVTKDNIETILKYSKNYPSSSQPEVKQINAKLEWLLSYYDHVLIISVASALSGTYSCYEKAIAGFGEEGDRITLVDSKLNSIGQGLIVLEAAKMANRNTSLNDIVVKIKKDIEKTLIYVSIDSFKYAVKSGRVPNNLGNVLVKMNVKPIMTLSKDGRGTAFGMAFSRKSIDKKIFKQVKKINDSTGIDCYAIAHASNPVLAAKYQREFETLIGKAPIIITDTSAITTVHAGIGSVAIALIRREIL